VLTQLAEDSPADPGVVVDLAARRRRKASALLVAAAAVVAIGVGAGQLNRPTMDGPAAGDSAGSDDQFLSEDAPAPVDGAGAGSGSEEAKDPAEAAAPPSEKEKQRDGVYLDRQGRLFRVRSDRFAEDVAKVRNRTLESTLAYSAETSSRRAQLRAYADFDCAFAEFGAGALVPVRYDAAAAILAFRAPAGDTQVVELVQCGSGLTLRSITLPGP